jgi:nicotinamidase/pyrazinamidase
MSSSTVKREVLIVIDPQLDFCSGGALPVPRGEEIVPTINRLAGRYADVVLTQDWHPLGHPGKQSFETIELDYGPQKLWPDHCVQGTPGASFHPALDIPHAQLVIRKGYRIAIDSYSAFRENDRCTPTGLAGYLRERGFDRVILCGLATDFCVFFTAMDARQAGFGVAVVLDACRAIDIDGSLIRAAADMRAAGVTSVPSAD